MIGTKVVLTCWSLEEHLSQIYAGLGMLHAQGRIRLEQSFAPAPPPYGEDCPPHLRHVRKWHCSVQAGDRRVYFDVHDDDAISTEVLEDHDLYMKRGFDPRWSMPPQVQPLGLNYAVFAPGLDRHELARRYRLAGPVSAAKYLLRRPLDADQIACAPSDPQTPRVLFLCRTWEPEADRTPEKNEERLRLNQQRADCIMALRRSFGAYCIAGFARSPHAVQHYPQLVVDDSRTTERRAFLKLVRSSSVCVATTGLHNSNGWKLAEYVANARPVVTEHLHHQVPGFGAGVNYLGFADARECAEAVGRLMDSPSLRAEMADANRDYYLRMLRPDRLVARALGLE